MTPALSNAITAIQHGPFILDLARAVTNSGDADSAAHWLLETTSRYLGRNGLAHGPLDAFDHVVWDAEALDDIWPVFQASEAAYRAHGHLGGCESPLPALARYLAERLPTMWDKPSWDWHVPVTRTCVLADNIDTMVGFFGVGIRPTGSKDPHALRRAAITVLHQVLCPVMRPPPIVVTFSA